LASWKPKGDLQIMIRPDRSIATPKDLAEAIELKYDDHEDEEYTVEQQERIKRKLANYRTGATAAIPLICSTDKCIFRHRCAFYEEGKALEGKVCLVEVNLINGWRTQYIEEYQINPSSFTELSMISELVEIELLLYRINSNLAQPKYASMLVSQTVGISGDGTPITRQELSPLFEARDRLNTRKSRLIKLMVGDRQEKYKEQAALKKIDNEDPSIQTAELRKQIEIMIDRGKKLQSRISKLDAIEASTDTPSSGIEQPIETPEETPRELTPEDILGINTKDGE